MECEKRRTNQGIFVAATWIAVLEVSAQTMHYYLQGIIKGCASDVCGSPIHDVVLATLCKLLQAQHVAALMHSAHIICGGPPEVLKVQELHTIPVIRQCRSAQYHLSQL